jgi:hypothetical protein
MINRDKEFITAHFFPDSSHKLGVALKPLVIG